MTITKLTPDQARALGAAVARACEWFRRIVDQFRTMARALVDTFQQLGETLRRSPAVAAGPSRPAWMSPYGPPAVRRYR